MRDWLSIALKPNFGKKFEQNFNIYLFSYCWKRYWHVNRWCSIFIPILWVFSGYANCWIKNGLNNIIVLRWTVDTLDIRICCNWNRVGSIVDTIIWKLKKKLGKWPLKKSRAWHLDLQTYLIDSKSTEFNWNLKSLKIQVRKIWLLT